MSLGDSHLAFGIPSKIHINHTINIRIIGVDEGELQLKGPENMFNKFIEENFPSLRKHIPMKVQEAYRTLNRLDQKKIPSPYNNQNTKHTE